MTGNDGQVFTDRPAVRPALRAAVLPAEHPRAGDRGDERARAGRRRRLRRPHVARLQGRVRARAASTSTRSSASRSSSSRATTTRATSATSTSRSCSASGTPCCASARRHDRRGRLERARPRQRPDRPRALPLDRGAVRAGRPTCASSSSTTICCPMPGTGRERNIVNDAGDTLETLQRANVDLVLSGHKHVPYAWRLEDCSSSMRARSRRRGCEATGGPVTTSSRSTGRTWTSGASTRSTARSRSSSSRPTRRRTRSTRRASRTR